MSLDRAPAGFDSPLVMAASFPIKRRGFDQDHVRRHLSEVSEELQRLRASEQSLIERLAHAEDRIAQLQVEDVERLTSVLGDEAARLLGAARQSAAERVSEAEARATQTLAHAEIEALTKRDEAAADASRARNDADEYARVTRRAADDACAALLGEARAEADRIVGGAQAALQAEIESGRRQGETLVREAELMREQILRDLARRRKQLRVQVEQLRVARERLLATHGSVRKALDDIENELSLSLPHARAAALAAGNVVEAEPELTIAELEDQLELARLAGFTAAAEAETLTLTGEFPVLDHVLADPSHESYDSDESEAADEGAPVADEPVAAIVETVESVEIVEAVEAVEAVEVEVAAVEVAIDAAPASPPLANDDKESDVVHLTDRPEPIVIDLRESPAADADDVFTRIREAREARQEHKPVGASPARVVVEEAPLIEVATATLDDASLLAQRDAVLDPFEVRIARLLKRAINEEQNRVQDAVRRAKGDVDLQAIVGTVDEHAAAYAAPLANEVRQLSLASQRFFKLPQRGDARAQKAVADVVTSSLIAPLRAQLERVCGDAVAEDERVDGVRAAYRDSKSPRADQAAKELTTTIFNAGVAAGVAPGDLRWVVDPEAGCSPDCLDNALSGGVPAGERFPAGQALAPSHPRCRCLIAPS